MRKSFAKVPKQSKDRFSGSQTRRSAAVPNQPVAGAAGRVSLHVREARLVKVQVDKLRVRVAVVEVWRQFMEVAWPKVAPFLRRRGSASEVCSRALRMGSVQGEGVGSEKYRHVGVEVLMQEVHTHEYACLCLVPASASVCPPASASAPACVCVCACACSYACACVRVSVRLSVSVSVSGLRLSLCLCTALCAPVCSGRPNTAPIALRIGSRLTSGNTT